ncbi:MAG: archaellin/type IV pilin N-terminal domain-containing protein [Acidilobus sp.]
MCLVMWYLVRGVRKGGPRRSLSNLIGAVILIAATIVGGIFVYTYFQRSVNTFVSMGSTVSVVGTEEPINATSSIVYIKVVNDEQLPIKVLNVTLVSSNNRYAFPVNQTVQPGSEISIIEVVPGMYTDGYAAYLANGRVFFTQPTPLG